MRTALPLAILILASACKPSIKIESDPYLDGSRIQSVGVMPFLDEKGRGRPAAEKVAAGLPTMGIEATDMSRLEKTFDELKLDRGGRLTIWSLNEVRQATGADALLFGSFRKDTLALLLVETHTGDVLVRALLPASRVRLKTADDMAAEALKIVAGPLKHSGDAARPAAEDGDAPFDSFDSPR